MKSKIAVLSTAAVFCILLAAPAWGQFTCSGGGNTGTGNCLYDNGPINGTTDSWTINFGYVVSDTFNLAQTSNVTGFTFGAWEFPGDVMTSTQWSMTSLENGGTVYGSGTASGVNLTDTFISSNQYGYDVDSIKVGGLSLTGLLAGQYWLNLYNAAVPSGDPVYWDENSGVGCLGDNGLGGKCPSLASESSVGTIPGESFSIQGTTTSTVPEPGSLLLLGSGMFGLMKLCRKKRV